MCFYLLSHYVPNEKSGSNKASRKRWPLEEPKLMVRKKGICQAEVLQPIEQVTAMY